MNRRSFLTKSCIGCLGAGSLLQSLSCTPSALVHASIVDADMIVPLKHFQQNATAGTFKDYVVVQNERLQYPICVYRANEKTYRALLMKCTHQGAELQVFGDKLQCPAHGSEFNNDGSVASGPADNALRSLPVTIEDQSLKISLRAS